jgi:hypothetical protein
MPNLTLAFHLGSIFRSPRERYVPATPTKPHRPIGKFTFCSLLAGRWCHSQGWHSDHLIVHDQWEHSSRGAHSCSKVPIAPMGKLLTCLPRLTLAQLRTLWSITECTCHRDLENFPSPPWETHVLLVACRAVVSMSMVAQWPSHRLPSVGTQLTLYALMFGISHRPHGRLTFCLLLAGRWCCCHGRLSVNRELPDLLQHS